MAKLGPILLMRSWRLAHALSRCCSAAVPKPATCA